MKKQQGRSRFKRHAEAGPDVVDVQDCYRRVENLRRALEVCLIRGVNGQSSNTFLAQRTGQNLERPKHYVRQNPGEPGKPRLGTSVVWEGCQGSHLIHNLEGCAPQGLKRGSEGNVRL